MESDLGTPHPHHDLDGAERAADRAEAAPWVEFPPTPAWYPPAVGVWAALLVSAFAVPHLGLRIAALVALVVVEGVFVGWYRRYRGAMPSGRPPREMQRPVLVATVTLAVVAVVVGVVAALTSPWIGGLLALVTVTPGIWFYERRYAEAAAAARERLA